MKIVLSHYLHGLALKESSIFISFYIITELVISQLMYCDLKKMVDQIFHFHPTS